MKIRNSNKAACGFKWMLLIVVFSLCLLNCGFAGGEKKGADRIFGVTLFDVMQELRTRQAIYLLRQAHVSPKYVEQLPFPQIPKLEDISTGELVDSLNSYLSGSLIPQFKDVRDVKVPDTIVNSVCAIIEKYGLEEQVRDGRNGYVIKTQTLRDAYNFCGDDQFADQYAATGIVATGFLVNDYTVATSGHVGCRNLSDLRFVFGFVLQDDESGENPWVEEAQVEEAQCVMAWMNDSHGSDWALIKIHGNMERPWRNQCMEEVSGNEEVFTLGHPFGLPMKYADGMVTESITGKPYFKTSLYTHPYNSGSPVIMSGNLEVIGIHDNSADFYESDADCSYWIACDAITGVLCDNECCGSREVRIGELNRMLKPVYIYAEADVDAIIYIGSNDWSSDATVYTIEEEMQEFFVGSDAYVWLLSLIKSDQGEITGSVWTPYPVASGQKWLIKWQDPVQGVLPVESKLVMTQEDS